MHESSDNAEAPVQERLVQAALACFLDDDYHAVTTRQLATAADTNISMIRYYFGSKEGLYEEMIRQMLQPLLDVLDGPLLASTAGFGDYFRLYFRTMQANPRFPALILKVLALNQGPGKRFIHQLLERGRSKARDKVDDLKRQRLVDEHLDPDMVRIAFVSLAMMPMLLKDVFEQQLGREMDVGFLDELADLSGRLFAAGLAPSPSRGG